MDKQKKGDLQGAIAAYTEAIRLNPNEALVVCQG
ncbi:MAG: tetratricopeptide repeat protein [Nostoc sp.]